MSPRQETAGSRAARDFATLRSFLSTARKQGWNAIEALLAPSDALLARLVT